MKHGKIRLQTTPAPTDNPKPKAAKSSKAKRGRATSEPVPQPSAALRKSTAKPKRSIEPQPQPAPAKQAKMIVAVPAAVLKSAAARKSTRVSKKTIENIQTITATRSPALIEPEPQQTSAPAANSAPVATPKNSPVPVPTMVSRPKVESAPTVAARPARQPRPVPVQIPAILLEPDHVPGAEPTIRGPGARFVATTSISTAQVIVPPELPESYGTKQIFLAARDPYWLLASWDLERAQQERFTKKSASGALTVRLRRHTPDGPIHLEIHTQANSKDWFIYAGAPDTTFVAELGYHEKNSGEWRHISVSKPVTTPRDRVAPQATPRAIEPEPAPAPPQIFRVVDPHPVAKEPSPTFEIPRDEQIIFGAPNHHDEPARIWDVPSEWPSLESSQPQRPPEQAPRFVAAFSTPTPRWTPAPARKWTIAQAKALDDLISFELKSAQQGSIELEELIQRHLGRRSPEEIEMEMSEAPSSLDLLNLAQRQEAGAPSSLEAIPAPGAQKGFWFRVNAELIIYGSTEPNARVSIGGRRIRLREDGSFSYRFALPDGAYELPIVAIAHDGHDGRAADLRFSRATTYLGHVGAHAQDPALKTPSPANI